MKQNIVIGVTLFILFFVFINSAYAAYVTGEDSAYSFNVTNCQVNASFVNCSSAVLNFSCEISNYMFIDYTRFMIDDNLYYTSRSSNVFWKVWEKSADTSNVYESYGLEREYITDTNSNTVIAFEEALVEHNCSDYCDAGYTTVTYNCTVYDNRTVEHISGDPGCAPSYNESQYCDYCTPSWELRDTGEYACSNGTRHLYYDDYNICCILTSLDDDCTEPYDHDTWADCSEYSSDFDVNCDPEPIISSKIDCTVEMNDTEDYSCITYVRQGGNYLQTNPQRKDDVGWWSDMWGEETETRDQFTITNGIGNVYYTDKNIIAYTEFVLGVRCTPDSGGAVVEYEQTITPQYDNPDELSARGVWFNRNALWITLGGFILFILLILVVALIRMILRR